MPLSRKSLSKMVPRFIRKGNIAFHMQEQSRITNKAIELETENREALRKQFKQIKNTLPAGQKTQQNKWVKKQEKIFFEAMSVHFRPRVIKNYTDLARAQLGIPETMTLAERREEQQQQEQELAAVVAERQADIEASLQRTRVLERETQVRVQQEREEHIASLIRYGHAANRAEALAIIQRRVPYSSSRVDPQESGPVDDVGPIRRVPTRGSILALQEGRGSIRAPLVARQMPTEMRTHTARRGRKAVSKYSQSVNNRRGLRKSKHTKKIAKKTKKGRKIIKTQRRKR